MMESVSTELREGRVTASRTTSPRTEMFARVIVITVAYAAIAILCLRSSPGSDPDIWWQMSAGRWILAHHALPHVDAFSRIKPSPQWNDYSWLFDIAMYSLYKAFGLAGLLGYVIVMVMAILAMLHRMAGRLQHDFLKVILLACGGTLCMEALFTPRSWFVSILFFIVQLDLLHRARRSGRWQTLLWLLPLYALWANIHIQFMDGLVVLGATACEPILMRFWPWPQKPPFTAGKLFSILGACIAATCINPYGWGLYHTAYKLVSEPGVINQITELLAMPFRSWQNYLVLGFAVLAAGMLARRRAPDLWRCLLLAGGLIISFRSQRDVWFVVAVSVMILAEELPSGAEILRPLPNWLRLVTVVPIVGIILVVACLMHVSNASLQAKMAKTLPVNAVKTALAGHYQGPLLNGYNWGGYLIWTMPMPVCIDGRAALYGDKRIARSGNTWAGGPDWASNPELKTANLIIGPRNAALTQILREDSDFRLVYHDKIAAIFVRNTPIR